MDTLELSIARARRALRWLAPGMLCVVTGACAGIAPEDELGGDVERLAERLVQTARERTDLRQLRVWVAEIHETRPQTARASAGGASDDLIALQLEHELVIALAMRLNVIDSELVEPAATGASAALVERAAAQSATHVLVGDYVRQRDVLQVTVRLIDADSHLIAAAARGTVRLAQVGPMSLDRWTRNAKEPRAPALAASGAAPGTVVIHPSDTPPGETAVRSAPTDASVNAPVATLPPAPPSSERGQQPSAATPGPGTTSSHVEDFESWRKRRQAEQESAAGEHASALDPGARARTDAAQPARRPELTNLQTEGADPFPWRKYPWLAKLLGVPDPPRDRTPPQVPARH
jgi:hypothetical protein